MLDYIYLYLFYLGCQKSLGELEISTVWVYQVRIRYVPLAVGGVWIKPYLGMYNPIRNKQSFLSKECNSSYVNGNVEMLSTYGHIQHNNFPHIHIFAITKNTVVSFPLRLLTRQSKSYIILIYRILRGKMKIKAIFFDLDGTLLPMDQDQFIKAYLGGLIKTLSPLGYEPEAIGNALWASTRAMMKNDGKITNEETFWQSFCSVLGDSVRGEEERLSEFYSGDFQKVREVCGYTPVAREIVDTVKASGVTLVLATSPLFPRVATESRIRWAGLEPDDFAYITTYENSSFCKPNPLYYTDLCKKLGLDPREVIMIGNDVGDDMVAAEVGMQVFLLTDCLINRKERDINDFRHGDIAALFEYIKEITE